MPEANSFAIDNKTALSFFASAEIMQAYSFDIAHGPQLQAAAKSRVCEPEIKFQLPPPLGGGQVISTRPALAELL
jgi:hypothetical protein